MNLSKAILPSIFTITLIASGTCLLAKDQVKKEQKKENHKNEETIKLEGKLSKRGTDYLLKTNDNVEVKVPEDVNNHQIKLESFLDKEVSLVAHGSKLKGLNGEKVYTLSKVVSIKLEAPKKEENKDAPPEKK